jgi:hypothetical protein
VDSTIAGHLLGALSQHPLGETEDTLLAQMTLAVPSVTKRQMRDVLAILINDGLILKSDGRFRFRSGLVRRYWQEHEGE